MKFSIKDFFSKCDEIRKFHFLCCARSGLNTRATYLFFHGKLFLLNFSGNVNLIFSGDTIICLGITGIRYKHSAVVVFHAKKEYPLNLQSQRGSYRPVVLNLLVARVSSFSTCAKFSE